MKFFGGQVPLVRNRKKGRIGVAKLKFLRGHAHTDTNASEEE